MVSHREEPNTKNINAWPEGVLEDKQKRKKDVDIPKQYDNSLLETAEFYIFLLFGSACWYWLVFRILDGHRFPYHNYTVEVCFIIAVPILLIAFLLVIMDKAFRKKND